MELNDVYQAPLAHTLSDQPSPKIGGWLRAFQIFTYLRIATFFLIPLSAIVFALSGQLSENNINILIMAFESLPMLVCSILIVKRIPLARPDTPKKIISLLKYMVCLSILATLMLFIGFQQGLIEEKPSPLIGDLLYFGVCAAYFKYSKRVRRFYGTNSDPLH